MQQWLSQEWKKHDRLLRRPSTAGRKRRNRRQIFAASSSVLSKRTREFPIRVHERRIANLPPPRVHLFTLTSRPLVILPPVQQHRQPPNPKSIWRHQSPKLFTGTSVPLEWWIAGAERGEKTAQAVVDYTKQKGAADIAKGKEVLATAIATSTATSIATSIATLSKGTTNDQPPFNLLFKQTRSCSGVREVGMSKHYSNHRRAKISGKNNKKTKKIHVRRKESTRLCN
jgi:hypothetical protein